MSLFSSQDRPVVRAIGRLCYTNPFTERRHELEQRCLGSAYRPGQASWSRGEENPNFEPLARRVASLTNAAATRLSGGGRVSAEEWALYADLVRYHLYCTFDSELHALAIRAMQPGFDRHSVKAFRSFERDLQRLCQPTRTPVELFGEPAHLFAYAFQVRRAFVHISQHILGASAAATELRAAVWQSAFTHDMQRYQRALYAQMDQMPTLIMGPSGTGKELVARAIGLSRYIAFDNTSYRFTQECGAAFFPLNITSLATSVLESELFGHRKGAFTGAVNDRVGWLEACANHGALFLDEIGELDATIQVKLLRVLQTRQFQRVGDTTPIDFDGKLITATNRELAVELQSGRFREDLYYRLCADVIVTPDLQLQLHQSPADLAVLVQHILGRLVEPDELPTVRDEIVESITKHLGTGYAWPGNVRELEQCVRSVLVRRSYRPAKHAAKEESRPLLSQIEAGTLTAEALLDAYCAIVYEHTGSYQQAARRMGLDRRTIKRRVGQSRLRAETELD